MLALGTIVDLISSLREMMSLTSVTTLSLLRTLLRNDADRSREASEVGIVLYTSCRQLRNRHYSRLLSVPSWVSWRVLMTQVVLVLLLGHCWRFNARGLFQNRVLVVGRVKVVVVT